jgi:ketopantoate reductase
MRSRHVIPKFRITIVGAGAIGLYYGGKLAQFGRDVHFLLRRDYETIRKRGLRIRSKNENIHVAKVNAWRSTEEIGPCDLALERWRKLVWNIPFNGLTITAGSLDTSAILANNALRQLALELMDETIAIANACGHPLPTAVALDLLKRTESMGAYRPSSLIDYLAGRPLEIEAIWGEPLRRARAAGIEAPRLEELYGKLVALDQSPRR